MASQLCRRLPQALSLGPKPKEKSAGRVGRERPATALRRQSANFKKREAWQNSVQETTQKIQTSCCDAPRRRQLAVSVVAAGGRQARECPTIKILLQCLPSVPGIILEL